MVLRLERSGTGEHFEDGYSQCPEINPFVVASPDIDFWGLVEMRTNYSKHVPPAAPLEGLLADAEIDDLDPLGLPTVENILGLDVPVANIAVMQILDGFDQFLGHQLDLLLASHADFCEAGLVEALHDQVGAVLLEVQVERLVPDDRRMSQFFQVDEIAF